MVLSIVLTCSHTDLRPLPPPEAGAALKPDADKSYLEQGSDALKGKLDVSVVSPCALYSADSRPLVRCLYWPARLPEVCHPADR